MNFEIVPLQICHIDAVYELEKECFNNPWSREDLAAQPSNENAHFLAAVSGDEVLGYIGIYEFFESCEIANLAVKKEFRRCGIAKVLINAASENAQKRGCEFITLEVRPSNEPALNLYYSLGFEKAGMRKNFYTSPAEDALILTKTFKEKK
ncbi:MAG: ribosomal protein S18-alanine N-acetyltransferase [Clostridia bacterium]|nr:ribosomal protein S18-alanine N-acetyltransferase [Clostridia bacterium]